MTRTKAIWFAVIAAASAAALLVAHLLMPIDASWSVNHYLHDGWQALVGLGGAGGMVWLMWPRPKARRR
ncbi:MAG: hypothetical protein NT049_11620, partial [Planctomycetota bacterium]|nr:hypothetical protein [Planctomycetota bacterium]